MTDHSVPPLPELLSHVQSYCAKIESSYEELQEQNKELTEDVEAMKVELSEKDGKIEELETALEVATLNYSSSNMPDNLIEIIRIAYQVNPSKVAYLLAGIPSCRLLENLIGTQCWLERSRTND